MFQRIDLRVEEMVDQGLLKVLLHLELLIAHVVSGWQYALCKQPFQCQFCDCRLTVFAHGAHPIYGKVPPLCDCQP